MARFCNHCGREVRMESMFCPGCGKELKTFREENTETMKQKFCTNCGKPLMEGALFCVNCGTGIKGKAVNTENEKTNATTKTEQPKQAVQTSQKTQPKQEPQPNQGSQPKQESHPSQEAQPKQESHPSQEAQPKKKKKSGKAAVPVIIAAVGIGIGAVAILAVVIIAGIVIAISRPKTPGHGGGNTGGGTGNDPDNQVIAENQITPSREEMDEEYAAIDQAYADGTLFAEDVEPYGHQSYEWFYDTENDWMQQEGVEEQLVELPEGKSKAFSIHPVDGVTIAAEENALDKDREFTFTPVSDEEFEQFDNDLVDKTGSIGNIVGAWELDIGLADDEVLPGVFTMTFDLNEFGLEEEDYQAFQVFRVDDNGVWHEFATQLNGSEVVVESRQNSAIIAVIGWSLIAASPKIISSIQAWGAGAYFNPYTGVFDLYDDKNKAVIQIMLNRSTFLQDIKDINEDIIKRFRKDANNVAIKKLQAEVGSRIKKQNDCDTPELKKKYNKYYEKALNELIDSNPDYKRIRDNIEAYEDVISEELESVSKVSEHSMNAWYFLKKQQLKMPTYKLRIELLPGTNDYGASINPYILGNPYICVYMGKVSHGTQEEYDMLLVTLCHEMFHVVQREYVSSKRSNYTFDEMTAGDLEEMVCDYFTEKGVISTPKKDLLETTLGQAGWFALPLNDSYESYPEGSISTLSSNVINNQKPAEAAYPRSAFLTYLREVAPAAEEEYSSILNLYRRKWFASVTSIIKDCYRYTDSEEKLTKNWHGFAQNYQTKFYTEAHKGLYDGSCDYIVFAPKATVAADHDKEKIVLQNKSYTIRVRRIRAEKPEGVEYAKEYALVLKYNDNYKEAMSKNGDFAVTPLGDSNKVQYQEWDKGLYFAPRAYSNPTELVGEKQDKTQYNYDYYLMEVDGGMQEEGWLGADESGYSIYALRNPGKPAVEVKDGTISVTLKDITGSERAEVVDSYVIKIRCDGKDVLTRQAMLKDTADAVTISGDELKLDGKKLSEEQKANLQLVIQECVTGTYTNGKGMFGPESEAVAINLSNEVKGYWKLTNTVNFTDKNREAEVNDEDEFLKYTAESGHYTIYNTYQFGDDDDPPQIQNDITTDYTTPKETYLPGETAKIDLVSTDKGVYREASGHVHALYDFTDDHIEAFKEDCFYAMGNHNELKGLSGTGLPVSETTDSGEKYEATYEVLFPDNSGSHKNIALIYEVMRRCGTIYIYEWVEQ